MTPGAVPVRLLCPWDSPGQKTGVVAFPSYGQQYNQDPPIRLSEARTLLIEGRAHPFLPESPLLRPLWASLPQKGCRGRGLSVSMLLPSLHCWRRMQPTQRVSVDWRAVQGGPQKRSVFTGRRAWSPLSPPDHDHLC